MLNVMTQIIHLVVLRLYIIVEFVVRPVVDHIVNTFLIVSVS